jgi:hypothetical protein
LTSSTDVVRRGSRQPRVHSVPAYSTTAGWEAIDLGQAAGLISDEWQEDILVGSLGERPNRLWSAPEAAIIASRQNGKNAIFEVRELAGLTLFGERFIVHTAHEMKTTFEAFLRSKDLFTNHDDLRKQVKSVTEGNGKEGIELFGTGPNRLTKTRRLRFIARSKHSGRGFTCDCLIWDEAYALVDLQVDAQMPALSAVPNPQIWYGSSPPLNGVDGEVLMRVRRRALAEDPQLAFFDFGLAGQLDRLRDPRCKPMHVADCECVDLDDRDNWYAANPALGIRISEETVARERRAMSDEGFARERLGVWPPDLGAGFQVIPEGDWEDARDGLSSPTNPVAIAAAVSLDRSRATIAACGRRADGRLHVEVTSKTLPTGEVLIDNRPGTPWVVPRLADIAANNRPCAIVMDEFGPTGSLIADAEAAGLEVTRINTGDVGRAFGMFYDGVSGKDLAGRIVRHRGTPELTAAVAGAVTRTIGDAKAWDRRNASVDITPLVAVTNALWGYVTRGGQMSKPFNTGVFVP